MRWVIAYDISCPRRLQKIHKTLSGYALPLQESVFLLEGSRPDLDRCLAAVLPKLNQRHDDLRIYPLPPNGLCLSLAKPALPDGILLGSSTW